MTSRSLLLFFPKNREFPGTPEEPFPGHYETATTLIQGSQSETTLFAAQVSQKGLIAHQSSEGIA